MTGLLLLGWVMAAIVVFVAGCAWRVWRYHRAPVHLRWDLYPVAHEPKEHREHGGSYLEKMEWWEHPRRRSLLAETGAMVEEIVLLKGVWENNRKLWRASLPFHWGLYLMALTTAGMFPLLLGWSWPAAGPLLRVAGAAGGILLSLGAGGLLALRSMDRGLKLYTTPLDRMNLALLLGFGILSTAVALSPGGVAGAAAVLAGALRGRAAELSPLLTVQMALGALFLMYLPFTRMIHMLAKYFTYHEVRWDDEPLEPGSAMARRLRKALDYGVDWSAGHVGAGRSWGEVATSNPPSAEKGGR